MSKELHVRGRLYSFGEHIGSSDSKISREEYEDALFSPTGEYRINAKYPFTDEYAYNRPDKVIGHCIIEVKEDGLYVDAKIRDDIAESLYNQSQSYSFNKKLSFTVKFDEVLLDGTLIKPRIICVCLSSTGLGGDPSFEWIE